MRREFTRIDEIALSSPVRREEGPARRRLELMRVQAAWRLAVGPRLQRVGTVLDLRDGCAHVEARDANWRRELERHEPSILARLRELLPGAPVKRLKFRVSGRFVAEPVKPSPDAPGPEKRAPAPTPAEATSARALREQFDQVMTRYLEPRNRSRG